MTRRWLKRLAAAAGVAGTLAMLAGIGLVADRSAARRADARRLDEAMAKLDAEDPAWTLAGVETAHNAPIPDDPDNVTKATLTAAGWRSASSKVRRHAILFAKTAPDPVRGDNRLPRDEEFCWLYEVHTESAEAHRLALAARRLPSGGLPLHFGDPDPGNTLLPYLEWVNEAAAMLHDLAAVEAYFGRGDEALRATEAGLHFTQTTLSAEPFLVGQYVRLGLARRAAMMAQQTLAWAEPSAELARVQAAFEHAAAVDGVTTALRGERATAMRVYDNVHSGALPWDEIEFPAGTVKPPVADRLRSRLGGRNLLREQADKLDTFNAFLASARLRGPARLAACDAVPAGDGLLRSPSLPTVPAFVEADDQARAQLLCAAVGLACERYRRQFGHFPASLADLPPSILPAIPADPFGGDPLRYQLVADGATVSSVGPGVTRHGDPRRWGYDYPRPTQFRLWNPESRRTPPPAPDPTPLPGDAP